MKEEDFSDVVVVVVVGLERMGLEQMRTKVVVVVEEPTIRTLFVQKTKANRTLNPQTVKEHRHHVHFMGAQKGFPEKQHGLALAFVVKSSSKHHSSDQNFHEGSPDRYDDKTKDYS